MNTSTGGTHELEILGEKEADCYCNTGASEKEAKSRAAESFKKRTVSP
jgi:hypothetical protein